jgi:hypothetical protein
MTVAHGKGWNPCTCKLTSEKLAWVCPKTWYPLKIYPLPRPQYNIKGPLAHTVRNHPAKP